MIIISTARMGHGTLQAKFIPLSKISKIERIFVLRKEIGPPIDKVSYLILPRLCNYKLFNLIITPILLTFYSIKYRVDLITAYHFVPHALFAYLASILSKKPFIFIQTGGNCQIQYKKNLVWRWIIKIVLKKAKYILVPGEQAKQFWTNQFPLFYAKIAILHSSINIEKFKPDLSIEKSIDILYVGALRPRKQVDKIIVAFSSIFNENHDICLGIIGEGYLEGYLKNMVNKLNLTRNVVFYGYQYEVLPYLQKSKIFIMTSQMEGLPVALMEAMSCGLIAIAPNVDNIPTVLIDGQTGYILEDTNDETIVQKIRHAIINYSKDQSVRNNAREIIIDKYSYSSAIEKWSKILHQF